MDFQDQQILSQYLQSGEHLLWTGRPLTGFLLRRADVFKIPFSILWGGIAFAWEIIAYSLDAPLFFLLFGVPFVLVGVYIIAGRFFVDMLRRSKTIYGLTDQRVLIHSGIVHQTLDALPVRALPETTLSVRPDGRGTITFGPTNILAEMKFSIAWRGDKRVTVPMFELIENASAVYQKLGGLLCKQEDGESLPFDPTLESSIHQENTQ